MIRDCRKCYLYSARYNGECQASLVVAQFGLTKRERRFPSITKARSKISPCGPEGKLYNDGNQRGGDGE